MTPNFDRATPAQAWMDYQSPPPAFMNLIALHSYTLVSWKPVQVKIVATSDGRNLFGAPWWTIEQWIELVRSQQ